MKKLGNIYLSISERILFMLPSKLSQNFKEYYPYFSKKIILREEIWQNLNAQILFFRSMTEYSIVFVFADERLMLRSN